MFDKLKEFFTTKKEKTMADTTTNTDTKITKQLKKQISDQAVELGRIRNRVGELRDEFVIMKNDINVFKNYVAEDMKSVVATVNKK